MKNIAITTVLILIAAGLNAQNFYDFKGVGARAAGMAFAFNAVADDATAISWNPAGLTQLKSPEFSVIQRLQFEEYVYTNIQDNTLSYVDEGNPYYTLDYFSFIYPFSINDRSLVLGVAYQNQINFKFNSTRSYPEADHTGTARSNLTVNSISLAASYSLANYLSLGVAVNYYLSFGNKIERSNDYLFSGAPAYENFAEYYNFSGINATVGAFFDLSSFNVPLRLAARLNTPLNLKNEFSSLWTGHWELTDQDAYRIIRKEGDEVYAIPLILGTGISYRIGDYLTLAADYDIKSFKDAKRTINMDMYDDLNYQPPLDETVVDSTDLLVPSNDNLNQFRIGAEYILHPEFALIPVRIGWKNNPTNVANYDIDGIPTSQVFASSFNAGFGLISRNFSIDFAYEYYGLENSRVDTERTEHTLHSLILSIIVYIR